MRAGSFGGPNLCGRVVGSRGHWDENVIVAMVAPVEVGAGRAIPHFYRVVVGPVDNDGVMVAACERVSVLFIAPFSVRA